MRTNTWSMRVAVFSSCPHTLLLWRAARRSWRGIRVWSGRKLRLPESATVSQPSCRRVSSGAFPAEERGGSERASGRVETSVHSFVHFRSSRTEAIGPLPSRGLTDRRNSTTDRNLALHQMRRKQTNRRTEETKQRLLPEINLEP